MWRLLLKYSIALAVVCSICLSSGISSVAFMVGLYFARILACSRVSEYETTITKKLTHEKDK